MSTGQPSPGSISPTARNTSASPLPKSSRLPSKAAKHKSKPLSALRSSMPSSVRDALETKVRRISKARQRTPQATAAPSATKVAEGASAKAGRAGEARPEHLGTATSGIGTGNPKAALDSTLNPTRLPKVLQDSPKTSTQKQGSHEDVSSAESPPATGAFTTFAAVPRSCDPTSPTSAAFYISCQSEQSASKTKLAATVGLTLLVLLGSAGLLYLATLKGSTAHVMKLCQDSEQDLLVETSLGDIRGLTAETVDGIGARVFLGIPFGVGVSGKRRFELATRIDKLTSPFPAMQQGPACLQPLIHKIGEHLPKIMSDDCLTVNIYTPRGCSIRGATLPVLFFITGWMSYDISWNGMFDWKLLASRGRVVVVAPNYRLGIVGFLNHGAESNKSNLGVRDILLAWEWTRKHIAAFGGDPKNVIPMAHASAAVMMTALLSRPQLLDVRRAVLLSQSLFTPTRNNSGPSGLNATRQVALQAGCCVASDCPNISVHDVVLCLSRLEPIQLISKLGSNFSLSQLDVTAEPFHLKPRQLPEDRAFFRNMQLLMGATSNEYDRIYRAWIDANNLTSAYYKEIAERLLDSMGVSHNVLDLMMAFVGDASSREEQISQGAIVGSAALHHCPMTYYATEATKFGAEVHFFILNEEWQGSPNGALLHSSYGDDLRCLSGSVFSEVNASSEQRLLSGELIDNVAAFAKTGKPGPVRGVGEWPLRSETKAEVVVLSSNGSRVQEHWLKNICTSVMSLIMHGHYSIGSRH